MRIPNHLNDRAFGFNMTPMIDVVFLLIIFFLVSMELNKQENRMALELSEGETGIKQIETAQRRLTFNVNDAGQIFIGGNAISLTQAELILRERIAEVGTDLEVRIRASRHVPYGEVNPILIACAQAGVWDVKYAIIRPERRGAGGTR